MHYILGKMEWKNQPEDYDYQQEVARAAFADMLHDTERVRFQNLSFMSFNIIDDFRIEMIDISLLKTPIYFQNKLYYDGLKSAIQLKRDLGQPVHVLDIGMFLSII